MCRVQSRYTWSNSGPKRHYTNVAAVVAHHCLGIPQTLPYARQMFENISWANVNATDFTSITNGITYLNHYSTYCCSDGKSAVLIDYSQICPNPQTYNGSHIISAYNINCQYLMNYLSTNGLCFENINWYTIKYSDFAGLPGTQPLPGGVGCIILNYPILPMMERQKCLQTMLEACILHRQRCAYFLY